MCGAADGSAGALNITRFCGREHHRCERHAVNITHAAADVTRPASKQHPGTRHAFTG